jgi:hypothetical protein
MCGPLALGIASFAVSAASTVAGFVAQGQEAEATREAAIDANQIEQKQLNLRQMQEADAKNQALKEQDLAEAEALAEVEVQGAAANVSGISLDNLKADIKRRAGRNRTNARTNYQDIASQLQLEKTGSSSRAQSRINSAPKPSPLSLIAGLGGDALGGFNSYSKFSSMT